MKLTVLLTLSLCWLLFSACDESEEEAINTLGADVQVEMGEYLSETQRTLMFKFFTLRDFACINHRISYSAQQSSDALVIALEKVEEPSACLKAMGPASAFVEVGSLNVGEYDFTLHIGEAITNTGKLTVTPESYELALNDEAGMIIETVNLQRVPKSALWGTIQYTTNRDDSFSRSFVSRLTQFGATQDKFSEGDYGFFRVDASGKITQPMLTGESTPFTFLMNYQGDRDEIISLLSEMNRTYGDEVAIRLRTASGDEFRSWDLP